jgi:NDP-sugar pyrophosphorylase family protein
VAILAGAFGSHIAEETEVRPKPMEEIGSYPILRPIMRQYSHYAFNDFVTAWIIKTTVFRYPNCRFAQGCSYSAQVDRAPMSSFCDR